MKLLQLYSLVTFLGIILVHPVSVYPEECYAALKIRAPENRPAHFAMDGCMANPVDCCYLTDLASRIPEKEAFLAIIEQCNACCQARAVHCYGYITGSWIDIHSPCKPQQIFSALKTDWQNLAGFDEPDCICLEYKDVNDEMDRMYSELKSNIQNDHYPTTFEILKGIVDNWEFFLSSFHFGK